MTKAAITFCGVCRKKVFKNPECIRLNCPKKIVRFQNKKGKANPKYSSKEWKSLRHEQLIRHPLCKHCLNNNKNKPATVVDHVKEWRTAPTKDLQEYLFNDIDNLQSLCVSCHNSKTARTIR